MRVYKVIRAVIVSLLALLIVVPLTLYIGLSLPSVQEKICSIAETELSKTLGTDVEIGSLSIKPFNQVILNDVCIADSAGAKAAVIERLGAGISLYDLISDQRIVINYAELIGLDAHINRATPGAPLNIQNIIEALKPKDKNKPPTRFDFKINTVVIRQSRVSYDVLSEPRKGQGRLDSNHIYIDDLRADIHIPQLKNDDFNFEIKSLAAREQSGFTLTNLMGCFHISSNAISIQNVRITLPNSFLRFADINLSYDGWDGLKNGLLVMPFDFAIEEGSYFSPIDFGALSPALSSIDAVLSTQLRVTGTANDINIPHFQIVDLYRDINIDIAGNIKNLADTTTEVSVNFPTITVESNAEDIMTVLTAYANLRPTTLRQVARLGDIGFSGKLNGSMTDATFNGSISTSIGGTDVNASYKKLAGTFLSKIVGEVRTSGVNLRRITQNDNLGNIAGNITLNATLGRGYRKGVLETTITEFDFKEYEYNDIDINLTFDNDDYNGEISVADPNATVSLLGFASLNDSLPKVNIKTTVTTLNLDSLNLWKKYPGYTLSAAVEADFSGGTLDNANGSINVTNLVFTNNEKHFSIDSICLDARNIAGQRQELSLNSDFIYGNVSGSFSFATLVPTLKQIMSNAFPVLAIDEAQRERIDSHRRNDFEYNFVLNSNSRFSEFFKLPISFAQDVEISGTVSHSAQEMSFRLHADEIIQRNKDKTKEKRITGTMLNASITDGGTRFSMFAQSVFPTKRGPMKLWIDGRNVNEALSTGVHWTIDRKGTFKGDVMFTTSLERDLESSRPIVDIDFSPDSRMIFNDTVWTISPANIHYADSVISIDAFKVYRDNQYVALSGKVSPIPEDRLELDIHNFNLDYVFETLEIDKAMLGGDATGRIYAYNLMSSEPRLVTHDVLRVKNISYNRTVLGDAEIKSWWDLDKKAVMLDALITQENGRSSTITGYIQPLNEYLDLTFKADRIKVGFMRPFMEAFASDVSGYASGEANLYGTFKNIDMAGDIRVRDLKLKINFTNVYYNTLDGEEYPIALRPGKIDIKGVTISDMFGNTAKLNGTLTHKYFKEPSFDFVVSDARGLLSYDVTSAQSPDWYGRIYGNGGAIVSGEPGEVRIKVDMKTAPNSTFTYVLTDREDAVEHNFISFRDRTTMNSNTAEGKQKFGNTTEASTSNYVMDITVGLENNPEVIVIMDPIGGDSIRSNGSGNIQMKYNAADNDLNFHGAYRLDYGSYNFTLQDIILKNFNIVADPNNSNNKSQITFNGDPYATKLDIWAEYELYANISDLDASFQQDKSVNQTNVPTRVIIAVSGDMLKPEISYKILFPSLDDNPDLRKKLETIIGLNSNNQEMVQQQVIYLLALNRFYTPDYMASTTKGNELFAVASSTITSRIGSMLGQLSDNWRIAPSLRSDQGDFSDVEVDLALSSRLLNNRLLFNGNFGYRDNSLNTNQFVGDFDIEYLLTPSGTWRLKAYNRYNDQNYYVKTATTTQGVGIVLKRDFDNIFSFLRRLRRKKSPDNEEAQQQPLTQPEEEAQPEVDETAPEATSETDDAGTLLIFK